MLTIGMETVLSVGNYRIVISYGSWFFGAVMGLVYGKMQAGDLMGSQMNPVRTSFAWKRSG